LQLNRVNRNSFQLQYGSSLSGFGRHTLILFLNDGFSGGDADQQALASGANSKKHSNY
jgi:hypothetical protein